MPKNIQAPAINPEMAQRMQQMVSQGYGQLQRRPSPQTGMSSVGNRNPQAIIDAARAKRGMAPIDWAGRQAELQAKAEAIAAALRQQQEAQAAMRDPNNPQNPNAQFAAAMAGGGSPKNAAPPAQTDLGYGGN